MNADPIGQNAETVADTWAQATNVATWLLTKPDAWIALGVGIAAYFALTIARSVIMRILKTLDTQNEWPFDDILQGTVSRTGTLFLLILAIYAGTRFLPDLSQDINTIINSVTIIAVVVQSAIWATHLLTALFGHYAETRAEHDRSLANAMYLIEILIKVVVWSIALLFVLDNLGVNVTALVAGLGIGGIAVGLAAQGIISDLFASLSIVFDKPFVTGDFIVFGDMMGSVERVGLKTTHIRSLSGEQIVVSNADLLSTRIRNYKRMEQRRVVFSIGVVYQTPHEKVKGIPQIIQSAVEAAGQTRFDRCHFQKFGDSALIFETVYYVLNSDYNVHMDIQQQINLTILKAFEDHGIDFAYPTQTVALHSVPAAAAS